MIVLFNTVINCGSLVLTLLAPIGVLAIDLVDSESGFFTLFHLNTISLFLLHPPMLQDNLLVNIRAFSPHTSLFLHVLLSLHPYCF